MINRNISYITTLLLFVSIILPLNSHAQTAKKLKVIATFSILGDIVQNVGGDKIDLTVLVGPNSDAHTFEPTPKDNILLAHCDLMFENGLAFEHWTDKLYQASQSKAKRVVVSQRIKLPNNDADPHIWQDITYAITMTETVRDALINTDRANTVYYQDHAQSYIEQLTSLDQWTINTMNAIPASKRKLVTSHNALGYFAKRYNLTIIGAAIPSATTEAEDPSAQDIAKLLDLIKSSGVNALFAENIRSKKLIQALSKDTGVKLAPALYTDALGAEGSDGDTYIKMMEHNVKILAEYLQ